MAEKFSNEEIVRRLADLPGWQFNKSEIVRLFEFENFKKSVQFVNRIGLSAEKMNHHPDILIQYDKVRVSLSTHPEGGITQKDFDLAFEINGLFG
ncbi:MAG: 4a-hydroxytetrahydrobiopterin dehydratase [Candidatus Micrarchaeota archaeon]